MSELDARTTPRWRMVVFWLLAVAAVFLTVGPREFFITGIVVAWGGYTGELATHEIHVIAQSAMVWALIGGFLVNVRRPRQQIGSAWQHGLIPVVWLGTGIALGAFPADVLPILLTVLVVAILAFVAHPSAMRDRFRSVDGPSRLMLALVGLVAVPLATFGTGQIRTHLASGAGDPHYEFGHWVSMGVFAIIVIALGAVAASRVPGWRVNAWSAGLLIAIYGVASLVLTAASRFDPVWAVAAIVWGASFITVAELEARGVFGTGRSGSARLAAGVR